MNLKTIFSKKSTGPLFRLLNFSSQYWKIFIIGVIGTFILSATDALFAWLVKPIINEGLIARNLTFIKALPFLIVSLLIIRGASSFCSNYFISRLARNIIMRFRQKIFHHLMYLPTKYYDRHSSGHILSTIIYNVEQVAQANADALLTLLRESTLLISLLVVMFVVSWQLTLVLLITAPFISWLMKTSSRRLRRLSRDVQKTMGDVTHIAEEGIEGYKVVRLYDGIHYEVKKFNNATQLNRHRELKIVVTNSLSTAVAQLLIGIPLALILLLATVPSLHITAGALASIGTAMVTLLRPVRRLTLVNNQIQKGLAATESIFELLDTPLEENTGTIPIKKLQGAIEYQDVTLRYDNAKDPAVNNVSLTIKPGGIIAIVGHSGSGKSSLINLLPRFYEPSKGKVLIDHINVNDYILSDLRKQFALVSQQTILFNDTIRHNIAYGQGCENVSNKAIIDAAEAAYAMEFINKLPEGLNTIVGENGVLLSGGQRQRLAIARALLRNAPILILDEATASLDTYAERQIQAALSTLMQNRTTLVIAHRLSTIENADRILVFDKGKLVEQGTHRALLAHGKIYAELYRMQFRDK
jgi:subfamily B ATP-binding cassette protein MsbA